MKKTQICLCGCGRNFEAYKTARRKYFSQSCHYKSATKMTKEERRLMINRLNLENYYRHHEERLEYNREYYRRLCITRNLKTKQVKKPTK